MTSKNLYAVNEFTTNGGCVRSTTPVLMTADTIHATAWFDAETTHTQGKGLMDIKPGESMVLSDDTRGLIIHHGWRISRLADFQMNTVYFDSHAKEAVLVTNGTDGANQGFVPTEAIALRPIIATDGKVMLAWTYRAVDAAYLSEVRHPDVEKAAFQSVLQRKRSARFIGRV